ncbi:MAG: RNA methyltransferase [Campylobacterales bacterium]|nr:RNA methyltransferase [Campylobacterales bacterium]
MSDSKEYTQKRAFFEKMLTIYGRNAVYEALLDSNTHPFRLHLSTSNKPIEIIDTLKKMATKRGAEILFHDKNELSRISKNAKQDQGVALDIEMQSFIDITTFLQTHNSYRILAVDGVENPQNLGLIIRSACAGNIDALLLAKKGNAALGSLVIKASAGTLFRMPILRVDDLDISLKMLQSQGAKVYTMSLQATKSYKEAEYDAKSIFVVGNESRGVSEPIEALSDHRIIILMQRGVESLNVAVAASLLAFLE